MSLRDNTLDMASQGLPQRHRLTPSTPFSSASVPASRGNLGIKDNEPPSAVVSVSRKRKADVLDSYPSPPPLKELLNKPSLRALKTFKSPSTVSR